MLGKTFKGLTDEMLTWQTEQFLARESRRTEDHRLHRPAARRGDRLRRGAGVHPLPGRGRAAVRPGARYRPDKTVDEVDTLDSIDRTRSAGGRPRRSGQMTDACSPVSELPRRRRGATTVQAARRSRRRRPSPARHRGTPRSSRGHRRTAGEEPVGIERRATAPARPPGGRPEAEPVVVVVVGHRQELLPHEPGGLTVTDPLGRARQRQAQLTYPLHTLRVVGIGIPNGTWKQAPRHRMLGAAPRDRPGNGREKP